MGCSFMCPGCFKMLDLDEFGNSTPTAEVKLVNGTYCGNCGRDIRFSYERALQFLRDKKEREQDSAS